jgi:hypothetical protein
MEKNSHIILSSSGKSYFILEFFNNLQEFEIFRDELYSSFPKNEVISESRIPYVSASAKKLVKQYGMNILWSILRTHPNVESRLKGHLIWDRSIGTDFWTVLIRETGIPSSFTSQEFTVALKNKSGVKNTIVAYGLLREGYISGIFNRNGIGSYTIA